MAGECMVEAQCASQGKTHTHTETQRMLVWVLLDGGESVFLRIRFYVTRSVWVKWKYQEKIVSKMKNMKVRTNIN